jgi:hypothetical protein
VISKRIFIGGLFCAPAIVRAESLMKVKVIDKPVLLDMKLSDRLPIPLDGWLDIGSRVFRFVTSTNHPNEVFLSAGRPLRLHL